MNAKAQTLLAHARKTLLTPYGLDVADLTQVFGKIMTHQVDYADLYFQYSRSEGWSLEEGIVKAGSFSIDEGVGVRALAGEKTAFAYSDDISAQALGDAAGAVRAIAAAGQERGVPALKRRSGHQLYVPHDPLASLDAASKVKLLEKLEAMARAEDSRVTQVMAHLAGEYEVILVAGSDGRLAADARPLVRVSLTVIVEAGGQREQGSAGGGGRTDYGFFTDALLQSYAREAVHQAVTNLAARPAPAGTMTVVLGAGWPGILLHEAVGHGLEGDFNRKGSSTFAGRIGSRVAASWGHGHRRRHPCRAARFTEHRRRRQSDAAHGLDRGRHPQGLHAGRSQRPFDGCRTHRQWPPGILCPPAAAADDQYHDVEW
jgi:TldD protein